MQLFFYSVSLDFNVTTFSKSGILKDAAGSLALFLSIHSNNLIQISDSKCQPHDEAFVAVPAARLELLYSNYFWNEDQPKIALCYLSRMLFGWI